MDCAAACSTRGRVAPIFAIAPVVFAALAEGLGPCGAASPLDTGQGDWWALTLAAIFASDSTAAAVLRAAAAKATVLLEVMPLALGPVGFGIVSAAPAEDACGVCQPLCFGGLAATCIAVGPGRLLEVPCHAMPPGGLSPLAVQIVCHALSPGGLIVVLAAGGEPWMLPATAAAVTTRWWAAATAAAAAAAALCEPAWVCSSSESSPPASAKQRPAIACLH